LSQAILPPRRFGPQFTKLVQATDQVVDFGLSAKRITTPGRRKVAMLGQI
jgi:hypothetical protein